MGLSIYTHPSIHPFSPRHYDVGERELSYTSIVYLSFIQHKSPARVCSLEVTSLGWFETGFRFLKLKISRARGHLRCIGNEPKVKASTTSKNESLHLFRMSNSVDGWMDG